MGRVWQGHDCGPGRELRMPPPVRVLDPKTSQIDAQLAGDRPAIAYQDAAHPPDTIVPQQIYDRPHVGDIQRDPATGSAQLVREHHHAD